MNNEKFGKLISEARKEKNLTQKGLAKILNVTDKAISKWERGKSYPDISLLEPLSEALNISVVELLKGEKTDKKENEDLKRLNYQYENQYKSLKEKTDYLIYHLNKVLKKLPEFIQNIVERLFNYSGLDLKYFKQQYDPEVKRKEESRFKGFNLFNKKEIEKSIRHINNEMDEAAEEFYQTKKGKEKDDGLSL